MGKFPTSLFLFYFFHGITVFGMVKHIPQLKNIHQYSTQLFWGLIFATLLFSLILHIKNPGYLQEVHVKQPEKEEGEKDVEKKGQNCLEIGENIIDTIPNNFQKRYCRLCNSSQPYRAKHCHDCGKCVLTFDHHCFFLNVCIGQKNRSMFYLFLIVQSLQLSYILLLTSSKIHFLKPDVILCVISIGTILSLLFCLILLIFHTYLMLRGITTWQYFSWKYISYLTGFQKNKSPFSKGICDNIGSYWSVACKNQNQKWKHLYPPA